MEMEGILLKKKNSMNCNRCVCVVFLVGDLLEVYIHLRYQSRCMWNHVECSCADARWDQEPHRKQEAGEQGRWVGPILLSESDLCSFSWQAVSACGHYRIMVTMAAWAELGTVCQCASNRGASLLRSSVMDTMGATDLLHQQCFCCCGQK